MNWAISDQYWKATGPYSGIRIETCNDQPYLVDRRKAKVWARGPFSSKPAAKEAAESRWDR